MSCRHILLHLDGAPDSEARLVAAAELAARLGARLSGATPRPSLPVSAPALEMVAYPPPKALDALLAAHDRKVEEEVDAARLAFDAAASAAAVDADWEALDGDSADELLARARCADLVIFPKRGRETPGFGAAEFALAAGAPVLLAGPTERPVGRQVLVAWNGGREAALALRSALPVLQVAEHVHVLMVREDRDCAEERLRRYLKEHGVAATILIDRSPDSAAAQTLPRQARLLGADLVVMGLYGRSRMREFVLGGVSRAMLADERLSLLVAH
jgi:nucleotide-binding universal stress UspA family protein